MFGSNLLILFCKNLYLFHCTFHILHLQSQYPNSAYRNCFFPDVLIVLHTSAPCNLSHKVLVLSAALSLSLSLSLLYLNNLLTNFLYNHNCYLQGFPLVHHSSNIFHLLPFSSTSLSAYVPILWSWKVNNKKISKPR